MLFKHRKMLEEFAKVCDIYPIMEHVIIPIVAAIASLLTFFSGFGLGTLLTPAFVLFFPVEIAVALTGIVHLLNNFFKISLVGKNINWNIGIRFGLTAIVGSFAGARLLLLFANLSPVYSYQLGDKIFYITWIKLIIGALMITFAFFESVPSLKKIQFDQNKLPLGGLISGFFGGLSGNQGALRSMFLIRAGLGKEAFIATGIFVACCVDITRLSIYFSRFNSIDMAGNMNILIITTLSAFAGAFVGSKLLKKITLGFVQTSVTVMIVLLGICLASGIL